VFGSVNDFPHLLFQGVLLLVSYVTPLFLAAATVEHRVPTESHAPGSCCCALRIRASYNRRTPASGRAKRGKAASLSYLQVDMEGPWAAYEGNPDGLRHALDQKDFRDWDEYMTATLFSGDLDCVKVLYENGYEQHRSTEPYMHPALDAVQFGRMDVLRCVVDRSGPPPVEELCGEYAVKGGVDMLQFVRALGCVFDEETTEAAAVWGNLEVLRYLHINGALWNYRTLAAAVEADSLPCLEYAHTHGCPQVDLKYWTFRSMRAISVPVLRYVCEHLDPVFAKEALNHTANVLSDQMERRRWASQPWDEGLDWPLVLYLARKLGSDLPDALVEAKATRTEQAVALAGVFWKAGRQLRAKEMRLLHREAAGGEEGGIITPADAERMALWDAMARVPTELQELIAVEAELIIPFEADRPAGLALTVAENG
jgi:hypothetical protein